MKKIKASIIVTNYNFSQYLRECIESIINQTYTNLEIIVVDDGSEDGSREEIQKLKKKDARIFSVYKENGGQASAFNAAQELVSGDFVSFMDSDDVWMPDKIEKVLEVFSNGDFSIVQHKSHVIEKGVKNVDKKWPYIPKSGKVYDFYFQENHTNFFGTTSGITTTREYFDQVLPIKNESKWRICADVPLTRHLGILGNTYTFEQPLGYYRVHDENGWMNSEGQKKKVENQFKYCRFVNKKLLELGVEKRIQFKKSKTYNDLVAQTLDAEEPIGGIHCERSQRAQLNESLFISRILEIKKQRGVMVDVGAHYGGSLSPYARADWRVLAFEPDSANRSKLLEKPFALFPDFEIVPCAVGAEELDGCSTYSSEENSGNGKLNVFQKGHTESAKVPSLTLKNELSKRGITKIDYLKIDAGGHELNVLKGMDFDEVEVGVVLIEFEDAKSLGHGYTSDDLAYYLHNHGFEVQVSEWWPNEKRGEGFGWKSLRRFPCEIPEDSWGNLIAWKKTPEINRIAHVLSKTVHFRLPEIISSPASLNDGMDTEDETSIVGDSRGDALRQPNSFGKWALGFVKRNPVSTILMVSGLIASFLLPGYFRQFAFLDILPILSFPVIITVFIIEYTKYCNRFTWNQTGRALHESNSFVSSQFISVNSALAEIRSRITANSLVLNSLKEDKNNITRNLIGLKAQFHEKNIEMVARFKSFSNIVESFETSLRDSQVSSVEQFDMVRKLLRKSEKREKELDAKIRKNHQEVSDFEAEFKNAVVERKIAMKLIGDDLKRLDLDFVKGLEKNGKELKEVVERLHRLDSELKNRSGKSDKSLKMIGDQLKQLGANFKSESGKSQKEVEKIRDHLNRLDSELISETEKSGKGLKEIGDHLKLLDSELISETEKSGKGLKEVGDHLKRLESEFKSETEKSGKGLKEVGDHLKRLESEFKSDSSNRNKESKVIGDQMLHLSTELNASDSVLNETKAGVDRAAVRLDIAVVKLDETRSELTKFEDKVKKVTEKIDATASSIKLVENVRKSDAEKIKDIDKANVNLQMHFLHLNGSNAARARLHKRFLSNVDSGKFLSKWSEIFNLDYTGRTIAYLAHQICNVENLIEGRLASDISTALLRTLALQSIRKKSMNVLEIGTLFGAGAIMLYKYGSTDESKIHVTIVDPLDGYYKDSSKDPITGIRIDRKRLERNFNNSGLKKSDYEIIQDFSEESTAIEKASKKKYDMIILDGDHSYEGVKRDFENYSPLLMKNGLLIFDDYDNSEWPDIKRYVDELLASRPNFELIGSDWKTCILRPLN